MECKHGWSCLLMWWMPSADQICFETHVSGKTLRRWRKLRMQEVTRLSPKTATRRNEMPTDRWCAPASRHSHTAASEWHHLARSWTHSTTTTSSPSSSAAPGRGNHSTWHTLCLLLVYVFSFVVWIVWVKFLRLLWNKEDQTQCKRRPQRLFQTQLQKKATQNWPNGTRIFFCISFLIFLPDLRAWK